MLVELVKRLCARGMSMRIMMRMNDMPCTDVFQSSMHLSVRLPACVPVACNGFLETSMPVRVHSPTDAHIHGRNALQEARSKLQVNRELQSKPLLANALAVAAAAEKAAKEAKAKAAEEAKKAVLKNLNESLDGTNDHYKREFDAAIKALEEALSPEAANAQALKDIKVCAEKP